MCRLNDQQIRDLLKSDNPDTDNIKVKFVMYQRGGTYLVHSSIKQDTYFYDIDLIAGNVMPEELKKYKAEAVEEVKGLNKIYSFHATEELEKQESINDGSKLVVIIEGGRMEVHSSLSQHNIDILDFNLNSLENKDKSHRKLFAAAIVARGSLHELYNSRKGGCFYGKYTKEVE